MSCEESRSQQLSDLKEASRFLGNCYAYDVLHGYRKSAEEHLAEIKRIEYKIKVLELGKQ